MSSGLSSLQAAPLSSEGTGELLEGLGGDRMEGGGVPLCQQTKPSCSWGSLQGKWQDLSRGTA